MPDDCQLKTGDVVFRRGSGLTSHVVLAADVNGNYSHLGIVVDSAGIKMVVHAVPGIMEAPESSLLTSFVQMMAEAVALPGSKRWRSKSCFFNEISTPIVLFFLLSDLHLGDFGRFQRNLMPRGA